MLNIDVSATKVNGSETATGKLIDREELESFLLNFSNEIFALLAEVIDTIGNMRYGQDFMPPLISPPVTFRMRGETDLTEELIRAGEARLPELARRKLNREYLSTRFSNSTQMTAISDLVMSVDCLALMTRQEIAEGLQSGSITRWQDVLHINIYTYIEEALEEDKRFLHKDMKEKRSMLQERARTETALMNSTENNSASN